MPCVSKALIIGGGIAGLSSAIALARIGVECEVFEKNDSKEGASIGLLGRAANALDDLGLYDLIYEAGTPFSHDSDVAAMRNSAGDLLAPGPPLPTWEGVKEGVGIYRPTLIRTMTKVALDLGVKITQGVTFSKIDNHSQGVTLTLTNGEQRAGDMLVGADGISPAFVSGQSRPGVYGTDECSMDGARPSRGRRKLVYEPRWTAWFLLPPRERGLRSVCFRHFREQAFERRTRL